MSEPQGFSIVELLVAMAIISTLLALALPAVTRVRAASRRLECLNHLHNISIGVMQFDHTYKRLPPSGSYAYLPNPNRAFRLHSWAVSILPFVEQRPLHSQVDLDLPYESPPNRDLYADARIPLYVCPSDISRSEAGAGDLSYAVSGGLGFSVYHGVHDCPVDWHGRPLDLNGDGNACSGSPGDDEDRKLFKQLGLFFIETRNSDNTVRHHSLDDVHDGSSQTFLVTENARTGIDPARPEINFAEADPHRSAVYIGNPCPRRPCAAGGVNYALSNAGGDRINAGLWAPEGSSCVPNSFHDGGVNMAFADGHVVFLSEGIDGGVYAAMSSPQGLLVQGTPLEQGVISAP
jgi:prepilin-type N-terminal cleavage/methylation domain-containing protein/prepilin-type processing-associated H-X9-DG protein